MTQVDEMRRLIALVETQQIDEIGRIGRSIGAAALGLSALAGSGAMASAKAAPVAHQTQQQVDQDLNQEELAAVADLAAGYVQMGYSKDQAQQKAVADFQKYHHRMPGETPTRQ